MNVSRISLIGIYLLWSSTLDAQITAIWANDGGDKVTQTDLRASIGQSVTNRTWNGTSVRLFGARNEVVSFNLVLEAQNRPASDVTVELQSLSGPTGSIWATQASGDGVFDWTTRPIELFLVRYLEIEGLSSDLHYDTYDERHIPERFRRPWTGAGDPRPGTGWGDRPDSGQAYPDIAVPLELVGTFDIEAATNQSIWIDVYIPRSKLPGLYSGTVIVRQGGSVTHEIPVALKVLDFTLPERSSAANMLYLGHEDVAKRYTGVEYPPCGSEAESTVRLVRDRHFQLAHRHRIELIDSDQGQCDWELDQPRPEWTPRIDGSLFTAANGYDGPGYANGNRVYSVGTYGSWSWQGEGRESMWRHTDGWVSWLETNGVDDYFLYLTDEPDTEDASQMAEIGQWTEWIESNPGPGRGMLSLVTTSAPDAVSRLPSLDIPASWFTVGRSSEWQPAVDGLLANGQKRSFFYNGNRPATGSFATEDDGVALRVLAWTQHKMDIDRWFYWESTYYNNFQGNTGETNVFRQAMTFGDNDGGDPLFGERGWNYGNGDGVLFYPGTDLFFPQDSYGALGPFASLRLKHWRRGIQDVEYLTAAARIDPSATRAIVERVVPRVMWENGVTDPQDPTWVLTDISWSTDPDDWEQARCELARIIDPGLGATCTEGGTTPPPDTTCPNGAFCLGGDRFRVDVAWRNIQGGTGEGQPVGLSRDTGAFWFFAADNLELVIKVLDGCSVNGSYWIFISGLTDVAVDITVIDVVSGRVNRYRNPLGTPFELVRDTGAFETCGG